MKRRPPRSTLFPYTPPFRSLTPLDEARRAFERDYLVRILMITGGNATTAARLAGRNRTEFYRLPERHSLEPGMFKGNLGKDKAQKERADRKTTRLNSSHANISHADLCLKNNN